MNHRQAANYGCLDINYQPENKILPGETINNDFDFVAKRPGIFYKSITLKGNTTPSFTVFNFYGKIED